MTIDYVKQTEYATQSVGRGRGSAQRDQRMIEKVRYQIAQVRRHDAQIAGLKATFGWKAFVTNAPPTRLSLAEAVLCYRHEYRVFCPLPRRGIFQDLSGAFGWIRLPLTNATSEADSNHTPIDFKGSPLCSAAKKANRVRNSSLIAN